jgi:hypothetical protein
MHSVKPASWNSRDWLTWDGSPTISVIADNLEHRRRTIVRLPMHYHPAFSACLYNGLTTRKRIYTFGDGALLERLARIDGLGDLVNLIEPMERADGRLRIRSPAPYLAFNVPPACRAWRMQAGRELQQGEPWNASRVVVPCPCCGTIDRTEALTQQY